MRLIIEHEADNITLPLSYQTILQGIVYNNLRGIGAYSSFMHNEGFQFEKKKFKLFSFGKIHGSHRIVEKTIQFTNKMRWEIRCVDPFLIHIIKENLEINGITYGHSHINQVCCTCLNDTVEKEIIKVKMQTPIVVYTTTEDRKTIYYKPNEEEFYYAIFNNFRRKYESCYNEEVNQDIQMAPVDVTQRDKVITRFKSTIIEGYTGTYIIKGPRKYLDFLYQVGIGSKNSQGFGLFDIIED